jgi:general secretion pathway protein G
MQRSRTGFTLVEILIVVVIMAILAATIIPQFTDSTKDAKSSTVLFNLHTLRSQIEMYKAQHEGRLPSGTLVELTSRTNAAGTIGTSAATFPYGPYLKELPDNPFTKSNTVKAITTDPAAPSDVTTTHGWIFSTSSGGIWINESTLVTE